MNGVVPVLPESAPFTPEQRAYLNGFLAGLFSRAPVAGAAAAPPAAAHPLAPLAILFGSQTGNSEKLAKRIAKEAGRHGFAPTIHDLARYPTAQLVSESRALIVTSTYGDGDPPDNAKAFWDSLASDAPPQLPNLRFSVCALGDLNYAKFCGFGKDLDARLEKLGATRVHSRVDCDVEFEEAFVKWLHGALAALAEAAQPLTPALSPSEGERENRVQLAGKRETDISSVATRISESTQRLSPLPPGGGENSPNQDVALWTPETPPHPASSHPLPHRGRGQGAGERVTYSRANPFPARLLTNRKLNAPGSGKDVRHFEIALAGSGLTYEAGDALGVVPQNDPALVSELLVALGMDGEEAVPGKTGLPVPLREALARHYEITRIPKPLLEALAARTGDDRLKQVTAPQANGELTKFLWGREIIDLLLAHPEAKFSPAQFVAWLRKLQPRLYSIASSPRVHPGEVHLTISALRYESLGRIRAGVCSTFLADRVKPDTPVPVFVHPNQAFRPPAPDTPLIMVGPGTGIAPFRAFLEERGATGAAGENWLFFGDQKYSTDFLYREDIESFQKDGLLTRLDLAWSRDQAQKIYVQHRLLEHAREVFDWLEQGAAFYVCGDASRMAKDVDAALREVIRRAGAKSSEQADAYVKQLQAARRYQRDVY
jgi:sulfite reductase (NADPH) flavoprotein alpha-component